MHYHQDNPFFHLADNMGTNIVHTNAFNSKMKVELVLYPPKIMPHQNRRAHTYNFGEDFRFDIQDRLNEISRPNHVMRHNFKYTSMIDKETAHKAILPNAQGSYVDLSTFNDSWTFILIVDNFGKGVMGEVVTPMRMLYSGWIMDEPITRGSYGQGNITNPNAVLVITHHTKLAIETIIDNYGKRDIVDSIGDYDYIDPVTAQNTLYKNEQLYQNDPFTAATSILPSDDGDHHHVGAVPMIAKVTPRNPYISLSSDYNNPISHLSHIVSGFNDTITGSTQSTRTDLMLGGGIDPKWATFASYVTPHINFVRQGDINPNQPITLQELENHFGAALIVRGPDNFHTLEATYDLSDPHPPTKRNVFTSLISTSLPPMMVNKSIAEMRFRYNSWMRPQGSPKYYNNDTQGIFHWNYLATLHGGGDEVIDMARMAIEQELKSTLWPIIKSTCNDFDVTVHISLLGSTLIDLQIYDDQTDIGLIETNNMLGGLNSPLIGNLGTLSNNIDQLTTSMGDMFAIGAPRSHGGMMGMNNYPY